MNAANHALAISTATAGRVAFRLSPEANRLVSLGRKRIWDFAVLGQAPMPTRPVRLGDWLMSPVEQDTSPIPTRALERVYAIYENGLRPKGFVVVHEAPKLLTGEVTEAPPEVKFPRLPGRANASLKTVAAAIGVAGVGVALLAGLAVVAVAALAIAALVAVPATVAVGAAVVDPILVAVTDDGYWIEVDRWDIPA